MQAPEDSAVPGSVYPPELLDTAPSPHRQGRGDQWLSDQWLSDQWLSNNAGSAISQTFSIQTTPTPHWRQVGGAIAGTAAVSAGLAVSLVGEQAISIPVGETYFPPAPALESTRSKLIDKSATQTAALNQGQGINPYVEQTQPALFSQSAQAGNINADSTYTSAVSTSTLPTLPIPAPQLVSKADGSWSLNYTDIPSSSAVNALPTQAIVNQLVTQNRAKRGCSGSACRSIDYINKQLPEAKQQVQDHEARLAAFEAQHGQHDLRAYQSVLSDRISEITDQKTTIALQLSATERYISQIKVRLSTAEVAPDLAEHLLAIDSTYQARWLVLQQSERQLLEEFSRASVDATALNQIYADYEQQQTNLYQAAQAVLGNHLLSSEDQNPSERSSNIYGTPAALDLLQSLTVAIHQKDVQQLRDRTVQLATDKLQTRYRQLAQNIGEYETIQRELDIAQKLVAQYEQESDRIATAAKAQTLIAAPTTDTNPTDTNNTASISPAFAAARTLEAKVPEGSIGKMLLGIVIAAGAVAVAAQRRAGDVSEALSLEIVPTRPQKKRFGLPPGHKRVNDYIPLDLLHELMEMTGQLRPAFAAEGAAIANQSHAFKLTKQPTVDQLPAASQISRNLVEQQLSVQSQADQQKANQEQAAESKLTEEIMLRELEDIVGQSAPEARFAKELSERNIEPVQLSLDEIDAFAESAVRWVLEDSNLLDDEGASSEREKETVDA